MRTPEFNRIFLIENKKSAFVVKSADFYFQLITLLLIFILLL